jgi:uncharacterized protein YaeQ
VVVYSYGGSGAALWREQVLPTLARTRNLVIRKIALEASQAMARLAQRSMDLSYTVQEGQVWVADAQHTVQVALE